jgi:hypothetical protein
MLLSASQKGKLEEYKYKYLSTHPVKILKEMNSKPVEAPCWYMQAVHAVASYTVHMTTRTLVYLFIYT